MRIEERGMMHYSECLRATSRLGIFTHWWLLGHHNVSWLDDFFDQIEKNLYPKWTFKVFAFFGEASISRIFTHRGLERFGESGCWIFGNRIQKEER